jgi:hypothetical protein
VNGGHGGREAAATKDVCGKRLFCELSYGIGERRDYFMFQALHWRGLAFPWWGRPHRFDQDGEKPNHHGTIGMQ